MHTQTPKLPMVNVGLPNLHDQGLLLAIAGLVCFGVLMVASASIMISIKQFNDPFHYVARQAIFFALAFLVALAVLRIELRRWYQFSRPLIILTFILLIVVLIPGLGKKVNGSTRWIGIGGFGIQVSELAKLTIILFLSGFITRYRELLKIELSYFIKPLWVLGLCAVLLLLQPDFGATVVIFSTAFIMLFWADIPLRYFLIILTLVAIAFAFVAIHSPYRLARITSFLHPWDQPFKSGYQLTQSLIAFGRGGWFGLGLGGSVQKLDYLPETHTDFIFAIIAEELGLIGTLAVIFLFGLLVWRGLVIAKRARAQNNCFAAFNAFGISIWLAMQSMVNIGVNMGVLPTKGLTLPLLSYGGSSLLIIGAALAILVRIDYEVRLTQFGFSPGNYGKKRK